MYSSIWSVLRSSRRLVFVLVCLSLVGCNHCDPEPDTVVSSQDSEEEFLLGYNRSTDSTFHIRESVNGNTWTDISPLARVDVETKEGLGIGDYPVGPRALVAYPHRSVSGTRLFYTGVSLGLVSTLSLVTSSSPSICNIATAEAGRNERITRWLFAYRNGDRVRLTVLDSDTALTSSNIDIPGDLNRNVVGKPAIIRTGFGGLLLAWTRQSGGLKLPVVATGRLESGTPVFDPPEELDLPDTNDRYQFGVSSDIDLGYSVDRMYLAVVREETGGPAGSLHGWNAVLYQTSDGDRWEQLAAKPGVTLSSYVAVASLSDATIVMVTSTYSDLTDDARVEVHLRSRNAAGDFVWTMPDARQVLGLPNNQIHYGPIELIRKDVNLDWLTR